MTQLNSWGGIIRWRAGEALSEPFQIGDGLYLSFLFLAEVGDPAGPYTFLGAINKEGDFEAVIESQTNVLVTMAPTLDRWHSLDDSRREVIPFYHLRLQAAVAPTVDYEARYVAKRP
jgi:hypothetical protein